MWKRIKKHPIKKNRPIASGKLPAKLAWFVAVVLVLFSVAFSYFFVGTFFTLSVLVYIAVQFCYSFHFRNIIILDSLVVAFGFVLRVFAGGFGTNTSLSSWLALTTIRTFSSLGFLARGARKRPFLGSLLMKKNLGTRKTLRHYPDAMLDSMNFNVFIEFCVVTYALFTFEVSPQGAGSTSGKTFSHQLYVPPNG